MYCIKRFKMTSLLILLAGSLSAQQFNSPVEYLQFMNQESDAITKEMWSYVKAAAHSGNARKIDKRRTALIETIYSAQRRVSKAPGYKGDFNYRNALTNYYRMTYNIMKEDFGKIVDMEAIAEQSYDLMEAYITAKEEAHKKLDETQDELINQQEIFANTYQIKLISSTDKKTEKLNKASKAFNYYNQVYLIFFKSYKQDMYLQEALASNNLGTIEQNKTALSSLAAEGLAKLDTFPRYGTDISIKLAAQNLLKFFQEEADKHMPLIMNYYLSKEQFEKTKAAFDAKRQSDRTKQDIDGFNKAVDDYNKSVSTYNTLSANLFKQKSDLLNRWNKASEQFFSVHVP